MLLMLTMSFANFDLNKFRFDYTPDEFINVDNDIQTNEDLTDKEIYNLFTDIDEEDVDEVESELSNLELESVIITHKEAIGAFNILFSRIEQSDCFNEQNLDLLNNLKTHISRDPRVEG